MNLILLNRFGFSFQKGGTHTSRTMMLDELEKLLSYVKNPNSTDDYRTAIEVDNCLGKRSGRTRTLTYRHMVDLYSLDPNNTLFRTLLFFWERDNAGHPLIALLCTYSRDPLLRLSAPFILENPDGAVVSRKALEDYIEDKQPGRFSKGTLTSTSQNINSTWTKSGHLQGRAKKIRAQANPTPGAVAYALFIGYLYGVRGESLFDTEFTKLLDCSTIRAIELAEEAARKAWIVFKKVGNVMELHFPKLLDEYEMEWIREQN